MMDRLNLLSEGTPGIVVRRFPVHTDTHLHQHDNMELVIIADGGAWHRTSEGRYRLARGDIFLIPVDMSHGYEGCDGLSLINVGYDPRRLDLPFRRIASLPGYRALFSLEPRLRHRQDFTGHLHLEDRDLELLLTVVTSLESELTERSAGWEQSATAWLLQILIHLSRAYARLDTRAARLLLRLGAVLEHIDRHLQGPIDLATLARIGRMSKSSLQRGFHDLYGHSVIDHVIGLRIQAATVLLAREDLAIHDIARQVGMADANYFTRVFTRTMGMPPGRYRSRLGVERAGMA